ncbi:Uncharacterised protein [Mycobacteroides abscessus]|nr:Uncharacterised protein [Mycobacteroides abscessus]
MPAPATTARTSAAAVSRSVSGSAWSTSCVAGAPDAYDAPKSSRSACHSASAYCTSTGRSRPYWARRASSSAGSTWSASPPPLAISAAGSLGSR